MAKYEVRIRTTKEVLAEHETRREAQNEIDWIEYCDRENGVYEENSYEIRKVEMR